MWSCAFLLSLLAALLWEIWQLQPKLSVSLACTEKTRKAIAKGLAQGAGQAKQMQPLEIRAVITVFEVWDHVSDMGKMGGFFPLVCFCSITEPVVG